MNLKKAKAIRGLVKQLAVNNVIKGEPHTVYGVVNHPSKLVNTGKTDKDGNPMLTSINRSTRVIDPMCPRGVYRRMKKAGPAAVLAGRS